MLRLPTRGGKKNFLGGSPARNQVPLSENTSSIGNQGERESRKIRTSGRQSLKSPFGGLHLSIASMLCACRWQHFAKVSLSSISCRHGDWKSGKRARDQVVSEKWGSRTRFFDFPGSRLAENSLSNIPPTVRSLGWREVEFHSFVFAVTDSFFVARASSLRNPADKLEACATLPGRFCAELFATGRQARLAARSTCAAWAFPSSWRSTGAGSFATTLPGEFFFCANREWWPPRREQ